MKLELKQKKKPALEFPTWEQKIEEREMRLELVYNSNSNESLTVTHKSHCQRQESTFGYDF